MAIGGAGMSGIARIMLSRGMDVSGCDSNDSDLLTDLRGQGARIAVGHDPAHLGDADTVVVSSAIRETNPELVAARQRGFRVLHRAEALASLMAGRRGVAVTGTHGKTTTTSMLVVGLQAAGTDPAYAIGGQVAATGVGAHDGAGDVFVAEADESDRSFLLLEPHAAIVTNVEADHLDNYGSVEAVHDAFTAFLDRIRGFLVTCADDRGARALAERARARALPVYTYGTSRDADLRIENVELDGMRSAFDLIEGGASHGRVELLVPGSHNVSNAAAALAAGLRLGYPFESLRAGIAGFTGARRRFELKGEARGVRVVDSYAHHHTEIAADLRTARDVVGEGRVIACFQPHLYSRTRFFAAELGTALGLADIVVVMDVYGAREDPEPGVTGALVADAVPLPKDRVCFEPTWSEVVDTLARRARPGDLVITLGAGDVTRIGPQVVEALRGRSSARV